MSAKETPPLPSPGRPDAEPTKAPEKRPDAPPTSRFGRLARLTALAPRALPIAMEGVKRAMGVTRTEDDERAARAKAARVGHGQ